LHIAQQMPLPLTVSCSSKSRLVLPFMVLPFWYLLTRVVPDKFQKSSKTIVCVDICLLQVSVLTKWLNRSGWFWHRGYSHLIVHFVLKNLDIFNNNSTAICNYKLFVCLLLTTTNSDFHNIYNPGNFAFSCQI